MYLVTSDSLGPSIVPDLGHCCFEDLPRLLFVHQKLEATLGDCVLSLLQEVHPSVFLPPDCSHLIFASRHMVPAEGL